MLFAPHANSSFPFQLHVPLCFIVYPCEICACITAYGILQWCSAGLLKWLLGGRGLLFINGTPLIDLSKSVPQPVAIKSGSEAQKYTHTHTHTPTYIYIYMHTHILSVSVDTVQMLAAQFQMKAGQSSNNLNHSPHQMICLQ